jgi:large subunit ribosomal protein L4
MEKKVFALDGSELRTIDMKDEVCDGKVSEGSIYHAIRNELANRRVGTASTKTRSEVRGSRRKPWRQKGIGRARAGRRRSPIWVGGGVTFGPRPRDYGYSIPKKVKRLAIKSIITQKNREERLTVVEDFDVASGKTKELVRILKPLTSGERTVLITGGDSPMLKRAGGNIPWLTVLSYNRLRAHDLLYGSKLLLLETAAKKLNDFFA